VIVGLGKPEEESGEHCMRERENVLREVPRTIPTSPRQEENMDVKPFERTEGGKERNAVGKNLVVDDDDSSSHCKASRVSVSG